MPANLVSEERGMPERPDCAHLECDARPEISLQKFRYGKPSPASFFTDADEEEHKEERLEKDEWIGPEWRVEACVKQHGDAEAHQGREDRKSQCKSVPTRVNAGAHETSKQFLDTRSSAKQGGADESCREHP